MKNKFTKEGRIVDVVARRIFKGSIEVENGMIVSVNEHATTCDDLLIPGLIDAHIHIESSMLVPSEFAKIAVTHGTVATVSDPHEIANVLGIQGVEYMLGNSRQSPFKFNFGAPSCVPATSFESSGAVLGSDEVDALLKQPEIKYLSEMMNFPGVIYEDKGVMAKLHAAQKYNKPVDGHAPGIKGEDIKKYIESGISTDHECFTMEEALEKIKYGMKVQIREGSAAKNFDALISLMDGHSDDIMFCSDDRHPDDLVEGHMNSILKRAMALGYDPVEVLRVATYNPTVHYKLNSGLLQKNDPADFVVIDNFSDFTIKETYIDGNLLAQNGKSLIETEKGASPNVFAAKPIKEADLEVVAKGQTIRVIQAMDGQLMTKNVHQSATIENGKVMTDPGRDILKIVVYNRYKPARPSIAFISGIGLKKGAMASTVAHDSHNIIAVGYNDTDLVAAINLLIETKGGINMVDGDHKISLPLPVAGIMSNADGFSVAKQYELINRETKKLGTPLRAPFMTLSFMALLVIPELKLSDKGLFDGNKFAFTSLFAEDDGTQKK